MILVFKRKLFRNIVSKIRSFRTTLLHKNKVWLNIVGKRKNMVIPISIILCLCFLTVCTVVALKTYIRAFGRVNGHLDGSYYSDITWNDIDQTRYAREEVRFSSGKNKLQGFVYGKTNSKGLVVISHGLGSTADSFIPMVTYFVDRGWRVFAFNNTGAGGSEGNGTRGLYQSLIDLDAALAYVENTGAFRDLPVMLLGHSWGGFAVCAVLNYNHKINAVASFAGYNSGMEVLREQGLAAAGVFYYGAIPQMMLLQKLLFGKVTKLNAVDGINKAGVPVLIVQCSDDFLIPAATTSIYAHREKITNPHVEIIYRDGEDATGHGDVFHSRKQREYMNWADKNWESYKAEHSNASRAEWAREINFDKALAGELDASIMERVEKLFESARQ